MWGFGLTVITIFWLMATCLGMWWMISVEASWRRFAWGSAMVLLPVLGVFLWMVFGEEGDFPLAQKMESSAEKDESSSEKTV